MELEDFRLELSHLVTPPGHLWVASGRTTVQPQERTVTGVGAFYSPPIAAHGTRLSVTFVINDTLVITDTGSYGKGDVGLLYQGGEWLPDRIIRNGTYNHLVDGRLRSLGVRSELVPLSTGAGYTLLLSVTNRSDTAMRLRVHPRLEPGTVELRPLSAWVFGLPRAGDAAVETGPDRYFGHGIELRLFHDERDLAVGPGETAVADIVVTAGESTAPRVAVAEAPRRAEEARSAWRERIRRYTERLPDCQSSIPGLTDYYARSVASGLVCIWDNPRFITNPFLATSGLDGGAICTYLWDLGGYVPDAATLLMGDSIVPIADALARVPLETYFAVTPDGSPTGTGYSYSVFSFMSLAWAVCRLVRPVERLYVEAKRLFTLAEERSPARGLLLDYGTQRNMLEMRGTGWEHVVASPNAERAWCLDRMADLGEWFGACGPAEAAELRSRAAAIRAAIRTDLWDPERRWFRSIFPDGHVESVHSIQAFDALRAGACDADMEAALLELVRDGAFLGDYGASSVSRTDPVHYEWNDPDWSGGGAYSGDPPALALTLYERGHAQLGWDVLRRLFWMGKHLPYFPQEHRCDVPQTLGHKRANVVSGLGGAEAIIFGLAGVRATLAGAVTVDPHPPAGEISLTGLRIRDTVIDIQMAPGRLRVSRDGKRIYDGAYGPVAVVAPVDRRDL